MGRLGFVVLAASLLVANNSAAQLSLTEQRGKQIYTRGVGAFGVPITAIVGKDSVETRASLVPCASCHGYNGRGRSETGVTPSDITWPMLTRPYKVSEASGREHGPYSDRLIGRAVTMGLDADGNRLSAVMPRYQLQRQDLLDLLAYLKTIGAKDDPGVGADELRIGVLLPSAEPMREAGEVTVQTLHAYFDWINQHGSIYGRKLRLRTWALPSNPDELSKAFSEYVREEDVFALIACFTAGIEEQIATLVKEADIPMIGPLALSPAKSEGTNPYVFYLDSGIIAEIDALQDFAARSGSARITLLLAKDGAYASLADHIRARSQDTHWESMEEISASDDDLALQKKIANGRADVLVVVAPAPLTMRALRAVAQLAKPLQCLLPGSAVTPEIFDLPDSMDGRVLVSFTSLPTDYTPDAIAEYRSMAETYGLSKSHLAYQFRALSSAHVLVEALRRSGRDVSRDKLLEVLESFEQFPTGFTGPVTFGPNRRIGHSGGELLRLDLHRKDFVPVTEDARPR